VALGGSGRRPAGRCAPRTQTSDLDPVIHYTERMEHATSCGECGRRLPESSDLPVEQRQPCPNCGSLTRHFSRYASDTATTNDSLSVAVAMASGPRPWIELWHQVKHEYDELAAMYSGERGVTNQQEILSTINNFFVGCYSLKDHIRQDQGVPAAVRGQVETYLQGDAALTLCGDVANTVKHHTRQHGRTARLSDWATLPDGTVTAMFGVTDLSGSTTKYDALNLARDAMAAWQQFINDNGLI